MADSSTSITLSKETLEDLAHLARIKDQPIQELADTVSPVNKKIIKIVSLPKLYCEVKKYFQFTSYIAAYGS